jgi:hypothetical protein
MVKKLVRDVLPEQDKPVNFICNICGIRAPRAVLCVKDECPTEILVYGQAPLVRL